MTPRWRNSTQGYGLFSIIFHWCSAITILGLAGLGIWMVDLGYYDAWYRTGSLVHQSVGILLIVATILRLMNKWTSPSPKGHGKGLEKLAAHAGHIILYTLILSLLLTGYLISAADGEPLWVFDWFNVPSWYVVSPRVLDWIGLFHQWGSYILLGTVILHVTAAFYHHLIRKDSTLVRMVWPITLKEKEKQ